MPELTEPEEICAAIHSFDITDPTSHDQLMRALTLSKRVMFQYAAHHIRKGCVCCVCNAKRMIHKLEAMGVQ